MVALRLLEVIRDRDLPGEILEDENPAETLPRRFGLNEVVERRIRTYKADIRKRVRLTDDEVGDLFRLVIRREDGHQVFEQAGRLLAAEDRRGGPRRFLPRRARFALARSAARRGLKKLFGKAVGGFGRGPFVIEGRSLFFIRYDPGGAACHLLTGFCNEVLAQRLGSDVRARHTLCQAWGDDVCRWQAEVESPPHEDADSEEPLQAEAGA